MFYIPTIWDVQALLLGDCELDKGILHWMKCVAIGKVYRF